MRMNSYFFPNQHFYAGEIYVILKIIPYEQIPVSCMLSSDDTVHIRILDF